MFLILDRCKLIKFATKNRNGVWAFDTEKWSNLNNDLVVKALESESRCPVFKTTGWLQGRLSISSFRGR